MKKSFLSVILAAASLMAVSCQKNELEDKSESLPEVAAVGFDAYTSTATTKGSIIEKTEVQAEGVGVFAFYQSAVSGQSVPFNTRKFLTPDFMYNQQVVYNGTDWTYTPVKYWPNNENDWLSFFAYAPYKANRRWDSMGISTNSNADKLNVTFEVNEDLASQEDILWATPQINQSNKMENGVNNTTKKVLFNFKHVTSKVDLMIGITTGSTADAWNDVNTDIIVKSIKFTNLNREFKFVYNISDAKLIEPATVDYCDGNPYTLCLETDEAKSTISEKNWGIPSDPLHTQGIFTSEHVAKYGYYYPCLQDNQHLFLAPQVFTDQTVTITYVVKTTDPNDSQNGSTITSSVTKKLASIFPYIGTSTTERGLESGKCYNIKFLIGLDDVNIAADVQDWDTDIVSKEIYAPSNYVVTMYQGSNVNPDLFNATEDIYINVRDIDLSASNSRLLILKDYAADPTSVASLTPEMVSKANTSESDLRTNEVTGAISEFVSTKATAFDNKTAKIDHSKLNADCVYVFEYTDNTTGGKCYTLVKVGPDPSTTPTLTMGTPSPAIIAEGGSFTVTVAEGVDPLTSVSGLRPSSFKVEKGDPAQTVENVFVIEETATAGTYRFTAGNVDATTEFTIRMNSTSAVSANVTVQAYSFSSPVDVLFPNNSVTVDILKDGVKDESVTTSEGLSVLPSSLAITGVSNGTVTIASTNASGIGTLIYKKNSTVLAILELGVVSYPEAPTLNPVKLCGLIWAPVNCGYDAVDYKFGRLYQWGRKYGHGYENEDGDYPGKPGGSQTAVLLSEGLSSHPDGDVYNGEFYYTDGGYTYWNWYVGPNPNELWKEDGSSDYNPCPEGWRIPTKTELEALINVGYSPKYSPGVPIDGFFFGTEPNQLFLPAAGLRGDVADDRGYYGRYWSSTCDPANTAWGYVMMFHSSADSPNVCDHMSRGLGYSIRCVLKQ